MKKSEVTIEQFARWSFERDLKEGCYDDPDDYPVKPAIWDVLTTEERKLYLEEADFYINHEPEGGWPMDILERLDG